jgi:Protein of unknown function (DUF1579)
MQEPVKARKHGSVMSQAYQRPKRGAQHHALEVFLGDWKAEGQSFGGPRQDAANPRGRPVRWTSRHSARWHTGGFFLIQDEHAEVDGPFDTLSIMGWDDDTGSYFARTFENHGFYRHYEVTLAGKVWTVSGESERAHIVFSNDCNRQTIAWEWRPNGAWLPLCERVATRA